MAHGMIPVRPWTPDEDEQLRAYAKSLSVRQAGPLLGRTVNSALGRWHRLSKAGGQGSAGGRA